MSIITNKWSALYWEVEHRERYKKDRYMEVSYFLFCFKLKQFNFNNREKNMMRISHSLTDNSTWEFNVIGGGTLTGGTDTRVLHIYLVNNRRAFELDLILCPHLCTSETALVRAQAVLKLTLDPVDHLWEPIRVDVLLDVVRTQHRRLFRLVQEHFVPGEPLSPHAGCLVHIGIICAPPQPEPFLFSHVETLGRLKRRDALQNSQNSMLQLGKDLRVFSAEVVHIGTQNVSDAINSVTHLIVLGGSWCVGEFRVQDENSFDAIPTGVSDGILTDRGIVSVRRPVLNQLTSN